MSGGTPRRKTWADDSDSDVDEAPAPKQAAGGGASGGTQRKGLTSWADSDTESDVDRTPPPEKKVDAFGEEESDSESEEEEEESEGERDYDPKQQLVAQGQGETPDSITSAVGTADAATEDGGSGLAGVGVVEEPAGEQRGAVTGEDPTKILNLSKKERKALKQKQLDELDALLGEFGLEAASTNGPEKAGGVPIAPGEPEAAKGEENVGELEGDEAFATAGLGGTGAGKKKKKKKKDRKAEDGAPKGGEGEARKEEENKDPDVVVVKPIAAALKTKQGPRKKSSGGKQQQPGVAAMKAAAEAAEKEAKKTKKKRDKKNFNQAPPGK